MSEKQFSCTKHIIYTHSITTLTKWKARPNGFLGIVIQRAMGSTLSDGSLGLIFFLFF